MVCHERGKELTIGTTSCGISNKPRDTYSICWRYRNVATYKWIVHNGKIETISLITQLLKKWYGSHHNLVNRYNISISQMTMDLLLFTYMFSFLYNDTDYLPDLTGCMSNTAVILYEAGTTYPSRASEFTAGFLVGSMLLIILVFSVVILCVCTFWVAWCPLRFPHKTDIRFVFISSCL